MHAAQRTVHRWHYGVLLLLLLFGGVSTAMLVSAAGGQWHPWAMSQLQKFVLAYLGMLVVMRIPIRWWLRYAYGVYAGGLLLLLGVEIMGLMGKGAQRWIEVGGMQFQPSELMKIGLILALARYFHQRTTGQLERPLVVLLPLLLIALPVVLILRQPNLGTSVILAATGIAVMFMAGVRWRYFIALGLAVLVAVGVVLAVIYLKYFKFGELVKEPLIEEL